MAKTAAEQLSEKKDPRKVRMDKDFAGIKKGQLMLVATPEIVAKYIEKIPYGQTRTIPQMRSDLAKRRRCDAACPVSTAIFARIAAQAALDEIDDGARANDVIPFWRVIGPYTRSPRNSPSIASGSRNNGCLNRLRDYRSTVSCLANELR